MAAPGRSELAMLGIRKNHEASSRAGSSPSRDSGGDSRAVGLYRQALLALGDADLAEQVVMCVIASGR
jgi:hypothetical protein